MATWEDVRRIAFGLPEVTERPGREGAVQWRIKDKMFAWERPLRRTDLEALGDAAPDGPVLAARVPDLGVRAALLAADAELYFTIPHFDGYPAILVRLDRSTDRELEELLTDAWLSRAPKTLARQFLDAMA